MFALSNAFQNDMTWAGSTKNHGGDIFQGKGLDEGQGLPSRDWTGVLPTQMFLNSNLVTPENSIPPFKRYSWFSLIQMDRHTDTDTQMPYKTNHPTTLYGYMQKFFIPHFSTSLKTKWACSLHFIWIKGSWPKIWEYNAIGIGSPIQMNVLNVGLQHNGKLPGPQILLFH